MNIITWIDRRILTTIDTISHLIEYLINVHCFDLLRLCAYIFFGCVLVTGSCRGLEYIYYGKSAIGWTNILGSLFFVSISAFVKKFFVEKEIHNIEEAVRHTGGENSTATEKSEICTRTAITVAITGLLFIPTDTPSSLSPQIIAGLQTAHNFAFNVSIFAFFLCNYLRACTPSSIEQAENV